MHLLQLLTAKLLKKQKTTPASHGKSPHDKEINAVTAIQRDDGVPANQRA
jgi:hypothetical protein